jgi:hypothetical protein
MGDVDWIQLAQDRDQWRALVNVAMNLSFLTEQLVPSQEKLTFSYLV